MAQIENTPEYRNLETTLEAGTAQHDRVEWQAPTRTSSKPANYNGEAVWAMEGTIGQISGDLEEAKRRFAQVIAWMRARASLLQATSAGDDIIAAMGAVAQAADLAAFEPGSPSVVSLTASLETLFDAVMLYGRGGDSPWHMRLKTSCSELAYACIALEDALASGAASAECAVTIGSLADAVYSVCSEGLLVGESSAGLDAGAMALNRAANHCASSGRLLGAWKTFDSGRERVFISPLRSKAVAGTLSHLSVALKDQAFSKTLDSSQVNIAATDYSAAVKALAADLPDATLSELQAANQQMLAALSAADDRTETREALSNALIALVSSSCKHALEQDVLQGRQMKDVAFISLDISLTGWPLPIAGNDMWNVHSPLPLAAAWGRSDPVASPAPTTSLAPAPVPAPAPIPAVVVLPEEMAAVYTEAAEAGKLIDARAKALKKKGPAQGSKMPSQQLGRIFAGVSRNLTRLAASGGERSTLNVLVEELKKKIQYVILTGQKLEKLTERDNVRAEVTAGTAAITATVESLVATTQAYVSLGTGEAQRAHMAALSTLCASVLALTGTLFKSVREVDDLASSFQVKAARDAEISAMAQDRVNLEESAVPAAERRLEDNPDDAVAAALRDLANITRWMIHHYKELRKYGQEPQLPTMILSGVIKKCAIPMRNIAMDAAVLKPRDPLDPPGVPQEIDYTALVNELEPLGNELRKFGGVTNSIAKAFEGDPLHAIVEPLLRENLRRLEAAYRAFGEASRALLEQPEDARAQEEFTACCAEFVSSLKMIIDDLSDRVVGLKDDDASLHTAVGGFGVSAKSSSKSVPELASKGFEHLHKFLSKLYWQVKEATDTVRHPYLTSNDLESLSKAFKHTSRASKDLARTPITESPEGKIALRGSVTNFAACCAELVHVTGKLGELSVDARDDIGEAVVNLIDAHGLAVSQASEAVTGAASALATAEREDHLDAVGVLCVAAGVLQHSVRGLAECACVEAVKAVIVERDPVDVAFSLNKPFQAFLDDGTGDMRDQDSVIAACLLLGECSDATDAHLALLSRSGSARQSDSMCSRMSRVLEPLRSSLRLVREAANKGNAPSAVEGLAPVRAAVRGVVGVLEGKAALKTHAKKLLKSALMTADASVPDIDLPEEVLVDMLQEATPILREALDTSVRHAYKLDCGAASACTDPDVVAAYGRLKGTGTLMLQTSVEAARRNATFGGCVTRVFERAAIAVDSLRETEANPVPLPAALDRLSAEIDVIMENARLLESASSSAGMDVECMTAVEAHSQFSISVEGYVNSPADAGVLAEHARATRALADALEALVEVMAKQATRLDEEPPDVQHGLAFAYKMLNESGESMIRLAKALHRKDKERGGGSGSKTYCHRVATALFSIGKAANSVVIDVLDTSDSHGELADCVHKLVRITRKLMTKCQSQPDLQSKLDEDATFLDESRKLFAFTTLAFKTDRSVENETRHSAAVMAMAGYLKQTSSDLVDIAWTLDEGGVLDDDDDGDVDEGAGIAMLPLSDGQGDGFGESLSLPASATAAISKGPAPESMEEPSGPRPLPTRIAKLYRELKAAADGLVARSGAHPDAAVSEVSMTARHFVEKPPQARSFDLLARAVRALRINSLDKDGHAIGRVADDFVHTGEVFVERPDVVLSTEQHAQAIRALTAALNELGALSASLRELDMMKESLTTERKYKVAVVDYPKGLQDVKAAVAAAHHELARCPPAYNTPFLEGTGAVSHPYADRALQVENAMAALISLSKQLATQHAAGNVAHLSAAIAKGEEAVQKAKAVRNGAGAHADAQQRADHLAAVRELCECVVAIVQAVENAELRPSAVEQRKKPTITATPPPTTTTPAEVSAAAPPASAASTSATAEEAHKPSAGVGAHAEAATATEEEEKKGGCCVVS